MLDDALNIAVIAAAIALITPLVVISGPHDQTVSEATPMVQLSTVVVTGKRMRAPEPVVIESAVVTAMAGGE
jgi:hypothetical protein